MIKNTKPQLQSQKRHLFHLLHDSTVDKFVMGRTPYAEMAIAGFESLGIKLRGVIDDFTEDDRYLHYPIYRSANLNPESLVVSCALDVKLISAIHKLSASGIDRILTYLDLTLFDRVHFPAVPMLNNSFQDVAENSALYDWLYNRLDDEESKTTLLKVLDFRYNFNVESMKGFSVRPDDQYFDIGSWDDSEVFVDCGAYDGETTKKFIERNPSYEFIYVFEPSIDQFHITCENLSRYPRVKIFPYATYNENTVLSFCSSKGQASLLASDGDIQVKTVRLDDVIKGRVTFVKLDVEGAEYETLLGAERLIREYKPKLAVCVYHKQEHFWQIPKLLLEYHNDYKIYLRHYTEGINETVMYFI